MKDGERERERERSEKWTFSTVQRCGSAEEDGKKMEEKGGLRWRWWQTWCALFLLPPATFLSLPVFSSASLIHSLPLLPFELMCLFMLCAWFFFFPLCPLYMMCSCTSDVVSCVYISVRSYWSHFHQPLFPLYHCFPSFLAVYILFSLSVRLLFVIPSSLSFSFHTLLCTVFCQDLIYCQHCHSPEFAVSLCQHPPCSSTSFLGLPTTETGWYSGWAVQYCGFLHV